MARNNKINIDVGFTVDKSGLQEMQSLFQSIVIKANELGPNASKGLKEAAATAEQLDRIMEKAFNSDLGSLNTTKFVQKMKEANLSINQIKDNLSGAGVEGTAAFNKMSQAILGTKLQVQETNKFLDRMATTFGNVIRYSASSAAVNKVVGSVEKAYSYSVKLNESLNNIRIVTNKSADEMDRFADKANDVAKTLSANTLDYTNAALIYYQQGLSDQEAQARAETTVKAANITGQKGEEVSEQLTAVWNGYKVTAEETELYVDKLAAVAATTAADLEELSVGMSKVASAANAMGVDFDDLNAQIATIVSVTRQAPESVGTALKTIYARLGDLKIDGVDEFGVSLGEVSGQLSEVGIQILDQQGNLRDMTSVMTEVAGKWDTWTEAQKQAIAIAMAGKRQYNNLLALFENWDMYSEALETSANAMGTLQRQQDIYMESTEARLNKLKATSQDLYKGLVNNDELNTGIDALTDLVQVADNFIDSFGGGLKSLIALGGVFANIFQKQIANLISQSIQKSKAAANNLDTLRQKLEAINAGSAKVTTGNSLFDKANAINTETQIKYAEQLLKVRKGLTDEEYSELTNLQQEIGLLDQKVFLLKEGVARKDFEYITDKERKTLLEGELRNIEAITEKYSEKKEEVNKELKSRKELLETFQAEDKKLHNINSVNVRGQDASITYRAKITQQILNAENGLSKADKQRIKDAVELTQILDSEGKAIKRSELSESQLKEELTKVQNLSKIILEMIEETVNEQKAQVEEVHTEGKEIEFLLNKHRELNDLEEDRLNKVNQMNAAIEAAGKKGDISTRVTEVTAAVSSVAMAWSSVSSVVDTLTDESLSGIEKFSQVLLTTTMALPMLIKGYKELVATLGLVIEIKETEIALDEKEAILSQMKILAGEKGAAAALKEAFAIKTGNAARATEIVQDAAKIVLKKALVATLIATVAVISLVNKAIQKYHENQIEEANATLKNVKATQEEIQAHKELSKSYNDLYAIVDKTKEQTESMQKAAFELADAYDDQNAKLLALAGSYEEFNKKIAQHRQKELAEEITNATSGAEAAANKAGHAMSVGEGTTLFTNGLYKAHLQGIVNSPLQRAQLETLGLSQYNNKSIDSSQEMLEYMEDVNNAIKYIQALPEEQRKAYKAIYKDLLDEQSQFAESYEELSEQINILNSAQVEAAFSNDENFDVTTASAEALYKKIAEIRESLSDLPEDQLNDAIQNYLSGLDDANVALKESQVELAEDLADEIGEKSASEYLAQIEDMNASQLALLRIHLDTGLLTTDLDQWLKDNQPQINLAGQLGANQSFKDLMNQATTDDFAGFNQSNIESIYNDQNMASQMGVSKDTFGTMDAGQQITEVTNAYIQLTAEIVKNKEAAEEAAEERRDAAEKTLEENKALKESFDEAYNKAGDFEYSQDQVKVALRNYAEQGEEADATTLAIVDAFQDATNMADKDFEALAKNVDEYGKYEDAAEEAGAELDNLKDITHNLEEAQKSVANAIDKTNASLDGIQSAYQSLTSMIDDYNQTGMWTVDNVQKLMTMNDQYVAQLQFENGQLSLNEEGFKAVTIAQLEQLKAESELQYQTEILRLAEIANKYANDAAAQAEALHAAQLETLGQVAAGTAATMRDLAEAMADINTKGSPELKAAAEQADKANKNRQKAADSGIAAIRKGGSSMRTAMGAGSKGGGSSKQSEKELKNLDDEFDRYWELNKIIDKTDKALQKLEKDKENLYRNELVDALAKENDLLEEQVQHYKDLAAAQRQEAGELQGKLLNSGVQFDQYGNITNYAAATQSMLNWYNQGVAAQNAGSISDDQFNKVYEKGFEEFKKNLERYDTLFYKELKDTEDKIDDVTRKVIANNLKKWEVEIELKLNLKELDREWNKFLKEINTDFKKVYKNIQADLDLARKNASTFTGENGTLTVDVASVTDLIAEFNKLEGGLGSDKFESISQVQDKMREVNKQLQSDAKELFDTYQDSWESYLDAIDQTGNKFDDIQNQFKKISDELEFQKDLINLIYGDKAYDLMDTLYKGQEQSTLAQITALKQESDAWKEMFDLSGATLENQAEWNEDQKKYYEEWQDAQTALNDLVKEHIDLLKNDYLNSINKILQSLEKGITKSSLNDVKTNWERISDHSSKYLDNIEKSYEIQQLANKFNEGIADTASLKNQQRLTQLRDREVAILREKEELTKFDIEAAEARYQIALKEIALEDAQNNKTNMKLTRNEQGNWSYQYVADEEDVAAKRQDLLASFNDLYQLASNAYESNLESLQALNETYLEKLREISELSLTDKEEAERQRLELDQWYFKEYELLATDNAVARQTLTEAGSAIVLEAYRQDQAAYEAMTQAERDMLNLFINENILDYQDLEDKIRINYDNMGNAAAVMIETARVDWNAKSQEMANTWNGDDGASVKNQVAAAYDDMEIKLADYARNLNALQVQAGVNFGEEGITGSVNQATNATIIATRATEALAQTMQSQLPAARAQVDAISTAWIGVKSSVEQAIVALQYYINRMVSAQQQAQQTTIAAQQAAAAMASIGSGGGSGSGGSGSGSQKLASNDGYTYYTDPNGAANTNAIVKNGKIVTIVGTGDPSWGSRKAAMDKWARSKGYDAFDTGGYTGAWNNGNADGKLAFLHQKELVLNADDTENFLSGINMIRNMAALNGSINDAIVKSVANMVLTLGETKAAGVSSLIGSNNSESNNNTFNITAEFPNANSVDEIREAILSLPNMASQYVNSNRI